MTVILHKDIFEHQAADNVRVMLQSIGAYKKPADLFSMNRLTVCHIVTVISVAARLKSDVSTWRIRKISSFSSLK
ncbi:hypothetical protein Y032_0031g2402 [Ancylostoma ceylanicum]|uniref:Uncharacterized protein n=1 Tax=Ancylostoma ceylanicum TaxID=53326 RepID=A0A016UQ42_9BILA|nr:hypothetical protein Y032_0031g2402 [Ancylostoma ceylanicum]